MPLDGDDPLGNWVTAAWSYFVYRCLRSELLFIIIVRQLGHVIHQPHPPRWAYLRGTER